MKLTAKQKKKLLADELERELAKLLAREECAKQCLAETEAKLTLLWRTKGKHEDER